MPHPKIAWLIESGGSELHDENKSKISVSLSYSPRLIVKTSTHREQTNT